MRHRVAYRKLGRVTEHRIAMLRNQALALIRHERIQTTVRARQGAAAVRRAHHHDRQAQPERARGQHARRDGASDGRPRHRRPRGRRGSCSTRSRRATWSGRAGTRGCSASAIAAVTAPRWREVELLGSEYDPNRAAKPDKGAAESPDKPKKKTMGGRIREALERPQEGRAGSGQGRRQGQGRQSRQRRRQEDHDATESGRVVGSSLARGLIWARRSDARILDRGHPVRRTDGVGAKVRANAARAARARRVVRQCLGDPDADGDADLFVGFNGTPNRLYRNDAGQLTDIAAEAGVADARATRAAAWGDYDADGDPDLLVGFAPGAGSVLRLYRNDLSGAVKPAALRFADVTDGIGTDRPHGRSPATRLDRSRRRRRSRSVRRVSRSRERASFATILAGSPTSRAGIGLADTRKSVGAVWFDADEDGDLDLYLANMDGDANALYRNDARQVHGRRGRHGSRVGRPRAEGRRRNGTVRPCAADVDGDGHLDLFTRQLWTERAVPQSRRRLHSRTSPARGGSRSTRGTTRARSPTSITTDGSISTSTARSPAARATAITCFATPARGSRT